MAGISEFCAKIMIQYADKKIFLVENGKTMHFTVVHRGIKSPRSYRQKHFFFPFKSYPSFVLKVIF